MNYYEILGLQQNSIQQEIKTSYKKLALTWHPDKNKQEGAKQMFQKIQNAYKTLSDIKLRSQYDNELKQLKKVKENQNKYENFKGDKQKDKQNMKDFYKEYNYQKSSRNSNYFRSYEQFQDDLINEQKKSKKTKLEDDQFFFENYDKFEKEYQQTYQDAKQNDWNYLYRKQKKNQDSYDHYNEYDENQFDEFYDFQDQDENNDDINMEDYYEYDY